MKYEALLNDADTEGLTVKERPFRTYDGRIKGKNIYLRKGMTTTEKTCVLAEELGHHYTTAGNIIDLSDVGNQKQELRARAWAYNKQIGLMGIVEAQKSGCQNLYEMAEYLDVTEEFLEEALKRYRSHYGEYVQIDQYLIIFEPHLAVIETKD